MSNKTNAKDKAERRRRKVIALFSDATNAPTVQDAARILSVSVKTIERDLKAVRADVAEAESKLEEYQRRFKERLPLEERVRLYEEIARQDGNLFARFKALQRVDDLDGIVTDAERLRIPRERDQQQPRPIFNIQAGARVAVTVNTRVGDTTIEATPEPTDNKEQTEVIDVTPESSESD